MQHRRAHINTYEICELTRTGSFIFSPENDLFEIIIAFFIFFFGVAFIAYNNSDSFSSVIFYFFWEKVTDRCRKNKDFIYIPIFIFAIC